MVTKTSVITNFEPSEGEKYLEEFFLDEDIKYEVQKKMYLKGDTKSFRVADFYLPKYDVWVEFFGKWNDSVEERARYREKKNIYFKNNIPCIYLYPENLGIIEHIFHLRMRKVLRQHGRRKELMRYITSDFHQRHRGILLTLGFLSILMAGYFVREQTFGEYLLRSWLLSVLLLGGYYSYAYFKFLRRRKRLL